ncbi:hypothetical protein N7565_18880 [Acinetobacter baumannii]|uniref:hypothetical protein n=1 Tax=Acinetobacter baumannii TaxID=470 RepID=UPI002446D2DE|nr:hypothetical protein [Acinetobacter baumannii]MDG9779487.1 hypothetical protein [Acinetobacter baumannii]MDH0778626.1 hypothetical protein [Acinetobacter baumannii]
MDNYKIKVKDEAESKEAQELFFALGASRPDGTKNTYHSPTVFGLLVVDGLLNYVFAESVFYDSKAKELTLPQLRDLVVLKCNDSRDANVNQGGEIPCLYDLYLTADKELYFYHCGKGKWLLSNLNHDEDYYATLKPIEKSEHQAPALISGADALRALADGKEVEGFSEENEEWIPIVYFSVQEVVNGLYKFRLKPQTIKLELELPKPFKPRDGDDCFIVDSEQEDGFYRFTYSEDSGFHQNFIQFGAYKTEDDVKKAVEQLRKIRGTNS